MQQQYHKAAGIAGLMSAPQEFQPTVDLGTNTRSVFEDYSHSFVGGDLTADNPDNENYSYPNAASCPDCSGGMIRLGGCFSCPSCGFESCSV